MLKKSFFTIMLILLPAFGSKAQVPQLINYQGMLTDAADNPINGSRSIEFKIYNSATGGSAVWSETQTVTITDGIFNVLLGSNTAIPYTIFDGSDKYLSLKVGTDPEMNPRKRLVSVGYSFRAYNTDKVDGQELSTNDGTVNQNEDPVSWYKIKDIPSGFADGTDDVGTTGGISQINVGTGMTVANPSGPNVTLGLSMGSGNGINADLVDGSHASAFAATRHTHSGADVISGKISNDRLNTGSGNGLDADMVDGKHASDFVTSTHNHLEQTWNMGSATTNGLFLTGTLPWANSLLKTWNYSNGPGIYGINTGGGNGVRGQTNGNGIGVYGQCDESGPGVAGRSGSGTGVEGYGYYGVYAEGTQTGLISKSTNGYGIFSSTGGGGAVSSIWGSCNGTNGTGVKGEANTGSGAYGVWGVSSSGYAGYFSGKVHVTGNLTKSGGSFKIDHPLDPANKYLSHSFVESPDMMNIYNGNVTLDANGEAVVALPDWFGALNKDFRYQLTAIGAPGPNLHIAEEISGNRFRIAGGAPSMKVSWQVTGIRQDAFANMHRILVEEEKSPEEQGKYLHPKEHGVPEILGLEYEKSINMDQEKQKMEKMEKRNELSKLEEIKND